MMMGGKWIVVLIRRVGFEMFDGGFATGMSQNTAEILALLRIKAWL